MMGRDVETIWNIRLELFSVEINFSEMRIIDELHNRTYEDQLLLSGAKLTDTERGGK